MPGSLPSGAAVLSSDARTRVDASLSAVIEPARICSAVMALARSWGVSIVPGVIRVPSIEPGGAAPAWLAVQTAIVTMASPNSTANCGEPPWAR